MRPENPLRLAADSLKLELIAVGLLLAGLYLIRIQVLDAQRELEDARRAKARAELDLDGALETISDLKRKHGDDQPGE